jgi:hypothetical protein
VGFLRHARMAASFSDAIRRQVTSTDVPPEPFASALRSAEAPPWQIEGRPAMVPSHEPSRTGHKDGRLNDDELAFLFACLLADEAAGRTERST